MLELKVLVHVRVVCHLQKVRLHKMDTFQIEKSEFQVPNSKILQCDHLLIANETDIGVAEPAFVSSYKLEDQLPSIAHLQIDHNNSHIVFGGVL